LIDEIFPVVFYQGSFSLFYDIDFESFISFFIIDSLFSIATLIISFFLVYEMYSRLYSYVISYINITFTYYTLIYIPLHSTTSFTIPIFQELFIVFSSYIIKGPINFIEVFTGLNSCFSIVHIHYFSYYQLVVLFFVL